MKARLAGPTPLFALTLCALTWSSPTSAEEEESSKDSGPSLGSLFDRVKDIKVPESVSNLPAEITSLKESYLTTAQAVEEMRAEIGQLREEVDTLRRENAALRQAVGVKVKDDELSALMKPVEISATDLVAHYVEDAADADERFRDRYLSVVGTIAAFDSGTQTVEMSLRAEGQDMLVHCEMRIAPDFFVDVIPEQGRLISRNDRRTLLSVGQPVTVTGTCRGAGLNVEMTNCRIEGLVEERRDDPKDAKK